jgi:nucleotide-binding universal stress UspA family protein
MYDRILVPVGGSSASTLALAEAIVAEGVLRRATVPVLLLRSK